MLGAYPMPDLHEALKNMAGAQWLLTLDSLSGFWQIELEERSRSKTAFQTPIGLFQFRVLPFGLRNAPPTFLRLMNQVTTWLCGLILLYISRYLGDNLQQDLGGTSEAH